MKQTVKKLNQYLFLFLVTIIIILKYQGLVFASAPEEETIVILDLKPINVKQSDSFLISEYLRSKISNLKSFKVLNRADTDEIKTEIQFQKSEACDNTQCFIEIGMALGAEKLLSGSLGLSDKTFILTLKIIDINKMSIDHSITKRCKCSINEIYNLIDIIVKEIDQKQLKNKKNALISKSNKRGIKKCTSPKNISHKAEITVSSADTSFPKKNAIDNSFGTYWYSEFTDRSVWLQLNWLSEYIITSIKLIKPPVKNQKEYSSSIIFSDAEVIKISKSNSLIKIDEIKISKSKIASSLQYTIEQDIQTGLAEIIVFGCPAE